MHELIRSEKVQVSLVDENGVHEFPIWVDKEDIDVIVPRKWVCKMKVQRATMRGYVQLLKVSQLGMVVIQTVWQSLWL